MDRLKYTLICLLTGINLASAQLKNPDDLLQVSTVASESLFVHMNTTALITGEVLFYKLYCLEDKTYKPSQISKVAYIELIDGKKKSVLKQKIALENGNGQGDFFIPVTLKTGRYKLIAYTKWMLADDSSNFSEANINIINPYESDNFAQIAVPKSAERAFFPTGARLEPEKAIYSNREKVMVAVTFLSGMGKGNYSVSVRRTDNLPKPEVPGAPDFKTSENAKPRMSPKNNALPELRGELISGAITSKSGAAVKNKTVALSVPGKDFAFKLAETDQAGKFIFILDPDSQGTGLVLQVMAANYTDYQINLDNPAEPDLAGLSFPEGSSPDPALKNTIESRSVAAQVENANFNLKRDSIAGNPPRRAFYEPLARTYNLDDYTRFASVKETIIEILTEISFRKNESRYSLRLSSKESENYAMPLVLADGLLIQDINEIFDYDARNIQTVSVVNEPYVYGPRTFGGIISFITKDHHFGTRLSGDFIKRTVFQRPLPKKKYFNPDYTVKGTNDRIPDYRQQLLWLPQWPSPGVSGISFYTSDVSGTFEIVLEGFSEDGTAVFAKTAIEVK